MIYDTRAAALASLREFSPRVRSMHRIVKFWSCDCERYRFCRVYGGLVV